MSVDVYINILKAAVAKPYNLLPTNTTTVSLSPLPCQRRRLSITRITIRWNDMWRKRRAMFWLLQFSALLLPSWQTFHFSYLRYYTICCAGQPKKDRFGCSTTPLRSLHSSLHTQTEKDVFVGCAIIITTKACIIELFWNMHFYAFIFSLPYVIILIDHSNFI